MICEDLPGNMRRTHKTVLWLDRLQFTRDRLQSYKVFFSIRVVQACVFDRCFCSNVALAEKKSQNPLHYRDFSNFSAKFKNNDQRTVCDITVISSKEDTRENLIQQKNLRSRRLKYKCLITYTMRSV